MVAKDVTRLVSWMVGSVIMLRLVNICVLLMTVICVRVAVGPGTTTVCTTAIVTVDVDNFVVVRVLYPPFS